jgi:hypothetical protein
MFIIQEKLCENQQFYSLKIYAKKRTMGRGILSAQLSRFEEIGELTGENLVWKRRKATLYVHFSGHFSSKAGTIFRYLLSPMPRGG